MTLNVSIITPADIQYQQEHRHDDNSKLLIVATTVCFALASISVVLRTIVRRTQLAGLGWDDLAIWISMLLATGLWIEYLVAAVKYGAGRHLLTVGFDGMFSNLKIIFAMEITYIFTQFAIKTSILLLYQKIFGLRNRIFAGFWWSMTIFVATYTGVSVILLMTQCIPLSYSWDPFLIGGSCVDINAIDVSTGSFIALTDLGLVLMPWPLLWSLKLPKQTKIGLCALFAFGFIAVGCSIVRILALKQVVWNVDFTFVEINPMIWSAVEVDIGIICACAPHLRPLFSGFRHRQENNPYDNSKEQSGTIIKGAFHHDSAIPITALGIDGSRGSHGNSVSLSEGDDLETRPSC